MSTRSSSSTPQARRNAGKIALGQRRQIVDQRPHRRVETVALDQLQRQTFGEAAGEDAGRLQRLQALEHRFDLREGGAEPLGDLLEGAREIARLVERVDQRGRDHAVGGRMKRDHRLPGQMLAQA